MTWIVLAKRFWPVIVGTLALLGAYLWHVGVIREARADERQKVTLAYQIELQRVITEREKVREEVAAKYEKRITDLEGSVAIELRGPAIRMCPPAVSVSAPQDPGGVLEGAGGESVGRPSRDLRGEIVAAGARCERMRQQLIAIGHLQAD